ncbi:MAG TPA: HAD-IC family P-type ATPase, partial [Caulobacter sp.]|nr:HAD-IC family P-type ATPase [Caulobacter sp.]
RHPLARALADAASSGEVATDVVEVAGMGVEGVIDGRRARLGRAAFLGVGSRHADETELWFGFDDNTRIRFTFEDRLRPDAAAAVAELKRLGLTVEVLSGDVAGPVARAALEAGVDHWTAGLTPFDKVAALDRLKQSGRKVLMVGDGLNDAAAIARAHASMAPGSAVDASQNAADLVFSGKRLDAVPFSVTVARAARWRALENFAFSALYNVIAAPAAMFGLVNPLVAAVAMSGSSLVVTLNALRMNLTGGRR